MDRLIGIIICIIVVFFFIDGLRRGLVRQLFEIVGLVAAFICAYYVGHSIAGRYDGTVKFSHSFLSVAASVVVFLVIVVAFHFIGLLLGKIVSVTILGPVDKIGGGLFGALKGVLFVSLLCVLCFSLPFPGAFKEKLKADPVAARIHPILPRLYESVVRPSPGASDLKKLVHAEMK
jgi:uncharacterized membrane protein required for colicin V production